MFGFLSGLASQAKEALAVPDVPQQQNSKQTPQQASQRSSRQGSDAESGADPAAASPRKSVGGLLSDIKERERAAHNQRHARHAVESFTSVLDLVLDHSRANGIEVAGFMDSFGLLDGPDHVGERSRAAERANAQWARVADKAASEESLTAVRSMNKSCAASCHAAHSFLARQDRSEVTLEVATQRHRANLVRRAQLLDALDDDVRAAQAQHDRDVDDLFASFSQTTPTAPPRAQAKA